MAFTVTPTSGSAPYLFEAEILNSVGIDWGLYTAHLYADVATGSCPAPRTQGTDQQAAAMSLVNTGEYLLPSNSVPSGDCRVYNFVIREVASGDIVASSDVSIDNV